MNTILVNGLKIHSNIMTNCYLAKMAERLVFFKRPVIKCSMKKDQYLTKQTKI